jgi:hypothetical protein
LRTLEGVKLTNLSSDTIYLKDLKVTHSSQVEGRRGEDRYLGPGASVYLPNTSEVLRSAVGGDIRGFVTQGVLRAEDEVTLDAAGGAADSVTLTHNLNFAPAVYVLKQVATTWVDATGTVDIVHDDDFTSVTITNTTAGALTFLIRLL